MSKNIPYNVMRHSRWDTAPRDPVTLFSYFSGTVGLSTGLALVATAVSYIAITAVTSWAISALMPQPDFSSFGSQGTLVNSREATASADFVYGQVRKGGTVTFYESTGDKNKYLHQIIVLAAHEVEEIGDIYVNDETVTIDSDGFVTDTAWDSKIRILMHVGNQTSTSDDFSNVSGKNLANTLIAESELTGSNALTSDFVGNGIAYLYVRYEYDGNVFASGVPLITALVKGKKVYDPRTSTTAYSNNAALCIRDFITSTYGLNDSAIDDVSFSAAANESDENVTLSGSGTEKRYTINGIIKASSPTGDVLGKMSTACAGTLFWGSGYWKLKVGAYSSPVKTLTLDDLRSEINLSTRSTMRDSFNGVTGTFNDASAGFITADYPAIKSGVFKTEDGGDELLLDLPLPFTTSAATAQRIAKMTLYRGREQMTISADFGLEAFNVEVGDIIAFTNPRYGFDEKEFEVVGWKFSSNQDAGDLRVSLTLQETSEAAFDWNAEESDIIGNNTNLPDPYAGLAVQNLTAVAGGRTQGDGTFINSAILSWDAADSSFVEYYDIEWKAASDTVYASTTTVQNTIEISPLIDNVQYNFRVRAVSAGGVKGAFATVNLTGGGDTTAPGLPTSITAQGGFRYITINWTNPADADLKHVEVWENDTNTTSGASLAGISGGSEFIRSNLNVDQTKYYFLKSVDFSANKSAFTSGVSATTTFLDDPDFENGVYSLFTEQGLYAIEDVTSLPASGSFVGEKVFNRTDGKLYQWTGSAWEAVVGGAEDFSDLTGSIADAQIPDGLIDTLKLANDAVTNAKIAVSAVQGDVIAAGAITETKVGSNAITTAKIAANAVTASEIAAGSITSSEIAADTIAASNIAAGAITSDEIAANAITSAKITAGAILGDKIAANTITGDKIGANEITGNKIDGQTITGDKIVANTITGGLLATSGIITNSAQITDAIITNAKISNISADKITAGTISADRIPTLSTNKFSTMSGQYGNRSGDTDSPAASGTITSFTYTPTANSVALLTLFIQGTLEQRPGGEGSYAFSIEVFVNNTLVLSTGGTGNTDGAVSVTLQGNYAFNASANTSQTVTVGWRQYNGRKGKLQINNGVISSIFTQD
jgi:hypothetical protein